MSYTYFLYDLNLISVYFSYPFTSNPKFIFNGILDWVKFSAAIWTNIELSIALLMTTFSLYNTISPI